VFTFPLIPAFSLWRRGAITCVDTYVLLERARVRRFDKPNFDKQRVYIVLTIIE
jgi:hypothetical protein